MHDRIFAIVLAGGRASRFGRLKQIEPVDGTCLLGIVIDRALKCEQIERVVLVLGAGADAVMSALGDSIREDRIDVVINDAHEHGLSTSLRAGLERAMALGCNAAALLLGDMPMIDTATIDTVCSRYRSSDAALCYVKSHERAGHPVIVARDLFDEFMSIEGDTGGREIVRRHRDRALGVAVANGDKSRQLDINTVEDMEIYRSLLRGRNKEQSSP